MYTYYVIRLAYTDVRYSVLQYYVGEKRIWGSLHFVENVKTCRISTCHAFYVYISSNERESCGSGVIRDKPSQRNRGFLYGTVKVALVWFKPYVVYLMFN